jgi:2-amino-4-hydroxy-6-hydroxymethyldihydropteridine diphosphokinase
MKVSAYIGLGSNLGDRRDYLERALEALRRHESLTLGRVSSLYETRPVGGPAGQGPYLNAAAEVWTSMPAKALLEVLLNIETALGRVRQEHCGPRTIDLDLLLFGNLVCSQPQLILPHPRMHERLFVLQPLAQIAPGVLHPLLNRTIADLLADLEGIHPLTAVPGRELTGKRALVTGSTSGIGRAIALELAGAGADVIIHGRTSKEAAEAVASAVRNAGGRSAIVLADLRQPESCERLVQDTWDLWEGLDIWINNAGADTLTGEAARWPFNRKLEELLAVDVTATMLLARAVGRHMSERGAGVILNMGWDQAESGMEGDSGELFAAIKGAVMAFSRSLARSLAPSVRVNCLAPGWIRTAWGEGASTIWQERVLRETPLRRWGFPEDVAATARWLVSPAARFITGQVVRVNGGAIC